MYEIPYYGLRAYALFFSKYGSNEEFSQSELDWIVSQSMKKKIFSLLVSAGWIKKTSRETYKCIKPGEVFEGLLEFKVPEIIKTAERKYSFTGLSAVEIWSDYSYVQRGRERSPYYVRVLNKDIRYWKGFFSKYRVPVYINSGVTIGEFVILVPSTNLSGVIKEGISVDTLGETMKIARNNEFYAYPYQYMREKHGSAAN